MKPRPLMDVPDLAAQAERSFFEERAAMGEYLDGMERNAAELAAPNYTQRWLAREAQAVLDAEASWRGRLKP